jgi:hypothetical protein
LKGYDEPEILPSSTRRICLIGADAGHAAAGNRWFDLGDVSLSPRMSDKERSISYFKRGFSSHLKVGHLWRWRAPADVSSKRTDERPDGP